MFKIWSNKTLLLPILVKLQFTEKEKTLLNKDHEPCDETYNEADKKERMQKFQELCRAHLWDKVSAYINCTIPGYENIIPESVQLPECSERDSAAESKDQLIEDLDLFYSDIKSGTTDHLKSSIYKKNNRFIFNLIFIISLFII